MSRTVAVIWHALFSIAAGVLYFFFVLPRWWELSGETSHTLGTVLRIVAGALIGLAALPVVFTWLRTRRPEYGTPQLALRLRLSSIVLHVLAAVLIIGTAISEIWFSLDDAGRWLFGIYGAAAAIGILAIFSFYLAFIAELPPPPPRPLKKKERKSRWRRHRGEAEEAETETSETEAEDEEPVTVSTEEADEAAAETVQAEAVESEEPDESPEPATDDEAPAAEDTVAAEPAHSGLRNQRPSGKLRRPRLRRRPGGVAVED
ncbi:MAG TPA: hypothetical protein VLU24_12445 [Mycobacterium sp.]|nr:hypothetical protein [Mycobacterium sp.]